jgi:hypothetical protein
MANKKAVPKVIPEEKEEVKILKDGQLEVFCPVGRVPLEGSNKQFIGIEPVIVQTSTYYRRLISDGSLENVKHDNSK